MGGKNCGSYCIVFFPSVMSSFCLFRRMPYSDFPSSIPFHLTFHHDNTIIIGAMAYFIEDFHPKVAVYGSSSGTSRPENCIWSLPGHFLLVSISVPDLPGYVSMKIMK